MSLPYKEYFSPSLPWLLRVTLFTAIHSEAAESLPKVQVISADSSFNHLVPADARIEVLTDQANWAEGPLCLSDGRVIWSEIKANKVMSWRLKEGVATWLENADYQNGHTLDGNERVVAASHGRRGIIMQESNGEWRTLVDSYQGKRLNSPNDVVVDKSGNLWFSDPTFGLFSKSEGYGGKPEQGGEFLYRYVPGTGEITRLDTPEVESPNGLAFSPDQQLLYVADSQMAHDFSDRGLAHRVIVYRVEDGRLAKGKVFAQIESGIPDGIKVDALGNLWSSSKEGIQVFSSAGKLLGKILIKSNYTSNLAFCSSGGYAWIFISAANLVIRVEVNHDLLSNKKLGDVN